MKKKAIMVFNNTSSIFSGYVYQKGSERVWCVEGLIWCHTIIEEDDNYVLVDGTERRRF